MTEPRSFLQKTSDILLESARLRTPWNRVDTGLAAFLGLFAIVTRIPNRSQYLNTWDSVLFALGLNRYNVVDARPHPPGYPVYLAMAKLFEPFTADENGALIALSIAFTAAAAIVLFSFMRQFGNRRAAFAGAFLFLMAPVLLFNSAIATSYPGEAFFTTLLAWSAWRAWEKDSTKNLILLGVVFLLALGFRQSMLFFLSPLVAYVLLWKGPWKERIRRTVVSGTAGLLTGLAWLIPMVALSNGLHAYRQATSLQTGLIVFEFTVFSHGLAAWNDHWTRFQLYIQWEVEHVLLFALVGVLIAVIAWVLGKAVDFRMDLPKGLLLFIAIWVTPAVAFYLLIFNGWGTGPPGYILVVLPAAYALMAWAMDWGLRILEAAPRGKFLVYLSPFLLLVPAAGLASEWDPVIQKEIRDHDEWAENWLAMNDELDPNTTAIVSSYSWAHVKWHHPDFILWSFLNIPPWEGHFGPWVLMMQTQHQEEQDRSFYQAHFDGPVGLTHAIPENITKIVLFDFQLAGENDSQRHVVEDVEVKEGFFENGWRYLYIEPQEDKPNIEDYFTPRPNVELP